MEKPETLYHASSDREIRVFEPRGRTVRDASEGPQVFASPDKRMAAVFMIPTDDSWANSGAFNGTPYLVVSDEKRFRDLDKGGAIYSLPIDPFATDASKGLGEFEWTSREAVRPLGKEEYGSALEAMLQAGVQVYFVDRATYAAIEQAVDHGYDLLKGIVSENKRLHINPVDL